VSSDLLPTFGRWARWMCSARALTVVAKLATMAAGIYVLGLVSSLVSVGGARRITTKLVEESYKRAVPSGPPVRWLDTKRLQAYPSPFPAEPFFAVGLRTYLFAPRTYYAPDPVPACPDSVPCCWALLVVRTPAPFVVRIHYFWSYLAAAQPLRGPRGAIELGVVTHLALLGLAIPIDERPSPP
jgi:hypothetical protein